jgi:hypothetical protein
MCAVAPSLQQARIEELASVPALEIWRTGLAFLPGKRDLSQSAI